MDYVKLGRAGLEVSRISLGCMTYGEPDRGPHEWTLTEDESRPLLRRAVELGVGSMQDHYNLLHREEEREMHPLCLDQDVAVLPWSPLARGRLTRDWPTDDEDQATARARADEFGRNLYTGASDRAVVDRVREVADERGVPRAQVALAWVARKPAVTAPIVGARTEQHLEDEVARLEEPYVAQPVAGFH